MMAPWIAPLIKRRASGHLQCISVRLFGEILGPRSPSRLLPGRLSKWDGWLPLMMSWAVLAQPITIAGHGGDYRIAGWTAS